MDQTACAGAGRLDCGLIGGAADAGDLINLFAAAGLDALGGHGWTFSVKTS